MRMLQAKGRKHVKQLRLHYTICSDSYINLEFLMHVTGGGARAWDPYEKWGIWLGFAKIVTDEKEVKGNDKGTPIEGRHIIQLNIIWAPSI